MHKTLVVLTFVFLLIGHSFAKAEPVMFIGMAYTFGANGGPGISLKLLSTNRENRAAVGAGLTYYLFANDNKVGLDVILGYILPANAAATVGWDFLLHGLQIGIGYVDSEDDEPTTTGGGGGGGTGGEE